MRSPHELLGAVRAHPLRSGVAALVPIALLAALFVGMERGPTPHAAPHTPPPAGTSSRGASPPATPGPSAAPSRAVAKPVTLVTAVSLRPVSGIDQRPCAQGGSGIPGPGPQSQPAGWCYHASRGLTLTRVEQMGLSSFRLDTQRSTYNVDMCIAPADRAPFVSLLRRSAGHLIAIVISGRVIASQQMAQHAAKTVLSFTNGWDPQGFTRAQASTLLHRLAGGVTWGPAWPSVCTR
jgi:hypothetical protein